MLIATFSVVTGKLLYNTDPIDGELWRPAVTWEGYYDGSNFGRVRKARASHKSPLGHILKPCLMTHYLGLILYRDGKRTTRHVHRVIAETFLDAPPSRAYQVNHKNGDKLDNRHENLEWVTASENLRHAYATGLASNTGVKNAAARLTEDDVRTVRKLFASGLSCPQIAKKLGKIHRTTVRDIVAGRTWTHVV